MSEITEKIFIEQLNAPTEHERLQALKMLCLHAGCGLKEGKAANRKDVNNHIHTTYSFSPYSPSKAVWMADQAGLATAGMMDHDSISGAREFITAGSIMSLPVTIGAECRSSFAETIISGRKINNPDQDSVAYMALHGVPHSQIDNLNAFFEPVRESRNARNREMLSRLNNLLKPHSIQIDYELEVAGISETKKGGSITERHLLYALSRKLLELYGRGRRLIDFLDEQLGIDISPKVINQLNDEQNAFISYDLLGLLKAELVGKIYIPADETECPPIKELISFADRHGIILAYPYLGDITDSVTGDKKAQNFEDSYLEELFELLVEMGIKAVTYMPSRNTRKQLVRLRNLCDKYGLFEISGEDINQPRQNFVCESMKDPFFDRLFDAAWALIGHEMMFEKDPDDGFFSKKTIGRLADLNERIAYFRNYAIRNCGQAVSGGKCNDR